MSPLLLSLNVFAALQERRIQAALRQPYQKVTPPAAVTMRVWVNPWRDKTDDGRRRYFTAHRRAA